MLIMKAIGLTAGTPFKPAPRITWRACVAILLACYFAGFVVLAILSRRGLVADGAGYFTAILQTRAVFSPEVSRWMANLLTQWPVLAALRLGVTDLAALGYLHSFGLYYLAAVTLGWSWILLPAERKSLMVLPLLGVILGWMGSCYDELSQGQVLALWFWPAFFALAFGNLKTIRGAANIILLVIPTILMHEAMCFLGPILAFLALSRAFGERDRAARCIWIFLGLWLIAGSALALYFTLVPLNAGDRQGFITGIVRFHFIYWAPRSVNPPVVVAVATIFTVLFCCRHEHWARRLLPAWLPGFVLLLLAAALAPILDARDFAPDLQSDARSWVVGVPLMLVLALIAYNSGWLAISSTVRPMLSVVVALAAASQITWQVGATFRWREFLDEFRQELAMHQGFVPYETAFGSGTTAQAPAYRILSTRWTFTGLSIALAPGGQVATIVGNPDPVGWQAFDPTNPAELPHIAGVDYSRYVKALGPASP